MKRQPKTQTQFQKYMDRATWWMRRSDERPSDVRWGIRCLIKSSQWASKAFNLTLANRDAALLAAPAAGGVQ